MGVSFLFRSDVHLADNNPVSWKADYLAELWESLRQIGELARQYEVTAVLDGGDFFHVKTPTRNSHHLVAQTALVHQAYPCPVWTIEGNHDVAYRALETLERQPLGVLLASGVFHQLRDEVFEADGLRVRVVGVPFSPFRTLEDLKAIKKAPEDDCLIVVVHALAAKKPPANVEEFFGEIAFRYEDLVYEDGPDAWCFGHWHRDQGIEHIDGRYFINIGAVSRGALIKENLKRVPKVALIEVTKKGISVSSAPLQVAPASEVFDLERKARQERESKSIEQFVERIHQDVQMDLSDSVEDSIGSLDFARDVRDLALGYLERARAGK